MSNTVATKAGVSVPAIITLAAKNGEARVDSRLIAQALDRPHASIQKLLTAYTADFQAHGILRFEIGEISGRGQPEKFARLNEDQSYARIEFDGSGQVSALWPINPDRVSVIRNGDKLVYEYTDSDGKLIRLLSHEVLHLRHRIGGDGVLGVSPIQAARGVIDLAQAEQDHGAGTFANGTRLSGVLKFPGMLKPEQRVATYS